MKDRKKKKRKPRCRSRHCKKGIAVQKKYICERKDKNIIKMKKRRIRETAVIETYLVGDILLTFGK